MSIDRAWPRPSEQPKQAAVDPGAARRLLTAPTTSASALLAAAKNVLGEFTTWEPETLWLECERRGLEIPESNRAKLQAALALVLVPSFYCDAVVLEKTALAFDHVVTNPGALEEATASQLAWAVKEAGRIVAHHGDAPREFAHEPAAYAAVVLHREGLVVAPEGLAFAQRELDRLNRAADSGLRERVSAAWNALDKTMLATWPFNEKAVDVQLARLAAVELHVRDRAGQAAAELAALS